MDYSKKLYRAGKGHVLGGVCAGLADYLSIDVVILRILWLVLTLVQGIGAIAYIVCLVLIPKNPDHEKLPADEQKKAENTGLYIGVALVVIGLTFAFNNWFHFLWWDFDWFFFDLNWHVVWPVLLIIFGVWYIYRSSKNEGEAAPAPQRKFYRSPDQRKIGGVCGGLAEYWNIDVTLVRVGYALATILTAVWLGVIAYIVMLIIVKEREPAPAAEVVVDTKAAQSKNKPRSRTTTSKPKASPKTSAVKKQTIKKTGEQPKGSSEKQESEGNSNE